MAQLPAYKITFDNGDTIVTSMAAHIGLEEAKKYYLGKYFNMGSGDKDKMVKATCVEMANSDDRKDKVYVICPDCGKKYYQDRSSSGIADSGTYQRCDSCLDKASKKFDKDIRNSVRVEVRESQLKPGKYVVWSESELPVDIATKFFDTIEEAEQAMQGLDKKETTPPIDISNSRAWNGTRDVRAAKGRRLFGSLNNAPGEREPQQWKCDKCNYTWNAPGNDEEESEDYSCPHCGSKEIDLK